MKGLSYELPRGFDQSDVIDLTPETQHSAELKPTSMVICLNRGPHPIMDMFDAQTYVVPGYAKFRCEFQVAKHLQRRNIVPGTRNPNPQDSSAPQYVPWITIIGHDPRETWDPFTEEQLAAFGEKVEGINRDLLPTAAGRSAEVIGTQNALKSLPGLGLTPSGGVMGGVSGKPDQGVYGGTDETRAAAVAPVNPGESLASQESAAAIGSGWVPDPNTPQTSAPRPQEPKPGGTKKR